MKWENLKNMQCPMCKGKLVPLGSKALKCEWDPECTFKINNTRFIELVNDIYRPKQDQRFSFNDEARNQEMLSAL